MSKRELCLSEKAKERMATGAIIAGLIAAGVAFWQMVAAIMWACYRAGVPM